MTAPASTPTYLCATVLLGRTLRYVSDPSKCNVGETKYVVQNHAPTALSLSSSTIAEDKAVGTVVGTFSAVDSDAGDSHTYSLVSGAGSADNAVFSISGANLKTAQPLDYETRTSYSIRVRATDLLGGTFERSFTITVTDVVEQHPPTDLTLSPSAVAENAPIGTVVGGLLTVDPDLGDTHSYSLVSGAGSTDNAKFAIAGAQLTTAAVLNYEATPTLSVRIQTNDGHGGLLAKAFTITVTDVDDAPVAVNDSATVAEDAATPDRRPHQ